MPFNGSGVFQRVRNWVADATAGIKIRADYHDAEDDGFAAGLTNCITKDGQTIVTQNIPFNSKRITGLADPINPQDAVTKASLDTKVANPGVLTGDITIRKDGPALFLDNTGTNGSNIFGQKNSKHRWLLRLGNDAVETGGNVGSDFELFRYADDGTSNLGAAMHIARSSGRHTINGDIVAARSANEGVVFLGLDNTHYLHWTGSYYSLANGKLWLGAPGTSGNEAVTFDQLGTKQAALGFTPVQQGGGASQGTNKIYIGWDGTLFGLRAQVDGVDLGMIYTQLAGLRPVGNARLLIAGDIAVATGPQSSTYEPFGGGVLTGWQWAIVGTSTVTAFRIRYMQLYTSSWFTIGYASS